jgi:hypothetical protein
MFNFFNNGKVALVMCCLLGSVSGRLSAEVADAKYLLGDCVLAIEDIRSEPGPPWAIEGRLTFTVVAGNDVAGVELDEVLLRYQMQSLIGGLYRLRFRKACIGKRVTGRFAWRPSEHGFGIRIDNNEHLEISGLPAQAPQFAVQVHDLSVFTKDQLLRMRSLRREMHRWAAGKDKFIQGVIFGDSFRFRHR